MAHRAGAGKKKGGQALEPARPYSDLAVINRPLGKKPPGPVDSSGYRPTWRGSKTPLLVRLMSPRLTVPLVGS